MNKNVLSLGAGKEQIPSILLAKKKGYRVIGIDKTPYPVGKDFCCYFSNTDTFALPAIAKLIKEHSIQWIIPSPIGAALQSVGTLNDQCNLPGITGKQALTCCDKKLFHKLLIKLSLPHPKQSTTPFYPSISKPRFGSGSHNVFYSTTPYTLNEPLLYESFIEGEEIGVDGIINNGNLHIYWTRKKTVTPLPYRQELSFTYDGSSNALIFPYLETLIKGLKLNNTLLNADIIINKNTPYIIDFAPRPAGYQITNKLMPLGLGINALEEGMALLSGDPIKSFPSNTHPVALYFLPFPVGKVRSLTSLKKLKQLPGVYYLECPLKLGQELPLITNGKEAIMRGYVIFKSTDKVRLSKVVETFFKQFMECFSNENKNYASTIG